MPNLLKYEPTRSAPLYWLYVSRVIDGTIVFQTRDYDEQQAELKRLNEGGAEIQQFSTGTRIAHRQKDGTIKYEQVIEPVRSWF